MLPNTTSNMTVLLEYFRMESRSVLWYILQDITGYYNKRRESIQLPYTQK